MMSLVLFAQRPPEIPPEAAALMVGAMLIGMLIGMAICLLILAVVCFLLYSCYQRIPVEHRRMESWQVWLLMIPIFNLAWNFLVFPNLSKSYQSYFAGQGRTDLGDCGEKLGMWLSICAAVGCLGSFIVGCLALPVCLASLVLLIMFLVKAWDLRGQIPEGDMMQPPMQPPVQPM